jgi:maltooligosyltrehalose trehalohydrolase
VIFSVWAPHARSVDLLLDGRRIPLASLARGYWQADVSAHAGQDYRYSLDGATGLPDPRSRWQPAGVHGASQVLEARVPDVQGPDRAGFRAVPFKEAIIYELHVGTFTPEARRDASGAHAAGDLPGSTRLGL